jgi:hypothetical protein
LDFHNGLSRTKTVEYKGTEVQQNRRKRSGNCSVDAREETARQEEREEHQSEGEEQRGRERERERVNVRK